MKILYANRVDSISFCKIRQKEKKAQNPQKQNDQINNNLISSAIYNMLFVKRSKTKNKSFDFEKISRLNIPNYCLTNHRGIRGETLSSPKNRKYLKPLKKYGLDTIVDLRYKFSSGKFEDLCKSYGLEYYRFPIDSSSLPDEKIIENLPKLFKVLNTKNYYIACAQGLHRTDIALALNYVFNPEAKEPPDLIGHIRGNKLKTDDINRRLNSIFKNLSQETLKDFGWSEYTQEIFTKRKKEMYAVNRQKFNLE